MTDQNTSSLKLIRGFYNDFPKQVPKIKIQKQEESKRKILNNKKKIKAVALSSSG